MNRPATDIDGVFLALDWTNSQAGKFARKAHINLQELRALKYEIRKIAFASPASCKRSRRVTIGIDSRVVVGAANKGRSSSYRLNGILRSLCGLLVGSRLQLSTPWVSTGANPADHPSRGKIHLPLYLFLLSFLI